MPGKIKDLGEISRISKELRNSRKKIVTTNGSFDILHTAHVNLLEKARKEGDVLIVLVNSDNSIRRNKGEKRPIAPESERTRMLSALASVDYVVIFDEDTPLSCLERIKPDVHLKGGSVNEEKVNEEKRFMEDLGGVHKQLPLEKGFSTTNIIEKILSVYK